MTGNNARPFSQPICAAGELSSSHRRPIHLAQKTVSEVQGGSWKGRRRVFANAEMVTLLISVHFVGDGVGGLSLSSGLVREASIAGGGGRVANTPSVAVLHQRAGRERMACRLLSPPCHGSIVRGLKLQTSRMTPAAFTESNTHTQTHSLSLTATGCPSPICKWTARDSWTTIGSRAGDRLDRCKST